MNMDRAVQITFFLLRVITGLMFLQHGSTKVFGWFGGMPPNGSSAELMSQMGVGGVLEFVGGLLILLGLFTRPAAFIVAGEMAVAYWQFHGRNGLWPILNHGEDAVLYCFIFLFIAAFGGGNWSLDAIIGRKRSDSGR